MNLNKAADIYYKNLWSSPKVLNYLINTRGLRKDILKRFKVGYAFGHLLKKQIKKYDLLIHKNKDKFEGYITFPNYKDNECIYMSGRSFPDKEILHLLLSGPKEFPYNYNALNKKGVILTESSIDALTLIQNGFNAVGIYGCGISDDMADKFRGKLCYIFLDYDNAGRIGASQISRKLLQRSCEVHILELPKRLAIKVDINSYFMTVQSAKDRVKYLIQNSVPIKKPIFGKIINKRKKLKYDKLNIVSVGKELFDDYIEKSNGIWIRCPHHKEGTEVNNSLWIGGDKNIFNCFGCNRGGGVIGLVMWHLKLNQEQSIEWLEKNFYVS